MDQLRFDTGTEISPAQNWIVLDSTSTMISFAVANVRQGHQKLVFRRDWQPVVVWSQPYGSIESLDGMSAWIAETNPGLASSFIRNLSGTELTFLWLLSYGREHLEGASTKGTPHKPIHSHGETKVIDVEAFRYLLAGIQTS